MEEVNAVMDFVNMLMSKDKITQSDIGICSPYKLQCKIIKQQCEKRNWKQIVIGPAEVFQGQEKPVMIVSTVRSGRNSALGDFLQNAQVRFIGHTFHVIQNDNHSFEHFIFLSSEIQRHAHPSQKPFDSRWESTFVVNKFKLARIH